MPLKAAYLPYQLKFKQPAGTSRGILRTKETFFLRISDGTNWGVGECALFRGLSYDDVPNYTDKLQWLCDNINENTDFIYGELKHFPSIIFGLEQAFLSLKSKNSFELYPSGFTKGDKCIGINGLIWMGDKQFMLKQIREKLDSGFRVIKLKIGAIDFSAELELLQFIRRNFPAGEIEIRVDANGAFKPEEALEKLKRLSDFEIHSIEQPVKAGQWEIMAQLCEKTPLPIALDEELIGVIDFKQKRKLIEQVNPQYIILKPALAGGFGGTREWIDIAEQNNTGWWITSALESNIGLNAIAQFTYTLNNPMVQGLGTGGLFTNNIPSPLRIKNAQLFYDTAEKWDLSNLKF